MQLEGGHAHHVGMAQEKRRQRRHRIEIGVADAGIEEHGQRQTARAFDVGLAQRVESVLRRVAASLLREIDVERDILQARGGELREQRPAGFDAVGEQRRPQARGARAPDDRHQFGARPQSRLAAGDLHVSALAVLGANHVDAAIDLVEWQVFQRLRRLGEVAQGAIEVAALRDLQRDATHRPAPPQVLARAPLPGRLDPRARALQRHGAVLLDALRHAGFDFRGGHHRFVSNPQISPSASQFLSN